jgi:hypothetical protein
MAFRFSNKNKILLGPDSKSYKRILRLMHKKRKQLDKNIMFIDFLYKFI